MPPVGDVLRFAHDGLVGMLAGTGFKAGGWEQDAIGRRRDGWWHELHLELVRGDPTGRLTVRVQLVIRDDGRLSAWRHRYRGETLLSGNWLAGQPLGYLAGAAAGQADLGDDPAGRVDALAGLAEAVRRHALPWFDLATDPETWIRSAPVHTLRSGGAPIVEWLASRRRRKLIGVLTDRVLAAYPADRAGFERGRAARLSGAAPVLLTLGDVRNLRFVNADRKTAFTAERLGWSVARWGGVPPAQPVAADGPWPLRRADGTPMTVAVSGRVEGFLPYGAFGGTIISYTREQAHDAVRRCGGSPSDTVTAATDLLVARDPADPAVATALAEGVPVMPAREFTKLSCAHHDRDPDRTAWLVGSALARGGRRAAAGTRDTA